MRYYVYCLHAKEDPTPRYVGVTGSPADRLYAHRSFPRSVNVNSNVELLAWLRRLLPNGPQMRVLCVVGSIGEAERIEELYITALITKGVPLLNQMVGGQRTPNSVARVRASVIASWTPERKAAFSQYMRAQPPRRPADWSAKAHVRRLLETEQPHLRRGGVSADWSAKAYVQRLLKTEHKHD